MYTGSNYNNKKTYTPFKSGNTSDYAYYIINNSNGSYYKSIGSTWKGYIDSTTAEYNIGNVNAYQGSDEYLSTVYNQAKSSKSSLFGGIPSVDEYMKASSNSNCRNKALSVSNSSPYYCKNNNWMYVTDSNNLLLMNIYVYNESTKRIRYVRGSSDDYPGMISYDTTNKTGVIRPTHLLKTDVKITGGNGTSSNPFTITR